MPYTLPAWQDTPSTATPISAANLTQANTAINSIDSRLTTVETGKVSSGLVNAQGKLISADNTGTPTAVLIGTNGQVLTADSTAATGMKWATPTSGGGSVNSVTAGDSSIVVAGTGTAPTVAINATGTPGSTTFLRGDRVWAAPAGASTPDATGSVKGIIQLAGDLAGTAASPAINATGTPSSTTFLRGDKTWAVPAGGSGGYTAIVDSNFTSFTPRTQLQFVNGFTVDDNAPYTQINATPAFDVDTTSNSVTRIRNAFDNLLSNSRFDSWSPASGLPGSWFLGSAAVSQVTGLITGTSAAQVTFTTAFGEFSQIVSGLFAGDWFTLSMKLEKVSGSGSARLDLVHHNFPFETYGIISPITIASGVHWIMLSAQVSSTDDTRVQFQSIDGLGSVWKLHEVKLQRGQGVANEWSPSIPELAGVTPTPSPHTADDAGSSGNPAKFNVAATVPFTKVLLTRDSFVNFLEALDDSYREFKVLIEQDSVGSHKCYFQPGTIAWAGGIEPHIDPLPGSFSLFKCSWLGTNYGLFIDATTGIPPYVRTVPDPYKGTALGGVVLKVVRGVTTAAVDNAVSTLLRYTTLAHRTVLGANAVLQYSGKFSADAIPAGAPQRGGGLDFYFGYETNLGPVIYGSPVPFTDATVHEYYHAEHDWYFPNGYGPETATTGQYAPYNGQTYKVLSHPIIQSCWYRAFNSTTTRTVSITTTSGSTTITSSAAFVGADVSGSVGLAGITATGIPAAATRTVTGGIVTGFSTVTSTSGAFTNADLGAGVSGTGIPSGSYIVSIISGTQVQIQSIATSTGTATTYTITTPAQIVTFTDSSHVVLSVAPSASATVTAIIRYSNGNRSALAEWYSQMRTSMKAVAAGDSAVYGTLLGDAGGDSTVVTDFQNFVTHVGYAGG